MKYIKPIFILIVFVAISAHVFCQTKHTFRHITTQEGLSHNNVNFIFQDSRGLMWFATQDGLCSYNGYTVKQYLNDPSDSTSIGNNVIIGLAEDNEKQLWISTNHGLYRFNPKTEKFQHFYNNPNDKNSLQSNTVSALFFDSENKLWIGTSSHGISCYNIYNNTFERFSFGVNDNMGLSQKSVLSITEAEDGRIFIGTEGGLNIFDRKTNRFQYYNSRNTDIKLSSDTIWNMYFDNQFNTLWLATERGLDAIDFNNNTMLTYKHDERNINSNTISNSTVRAVAKDKYGNIWVGTMEGLDILTPYQKDQQIIHYHHKVGKLGDLTYFQIWSIFVDKQGIIWIGTFSGGVNFTNSAKASFELFQYDSKNPFSLSESSVMAFLEDRNGQFWIGTDGGGLNLFDRNTENFTAYKHSAVENSLVFNTVLELEEDAAGNIWIGTWAFGVDCFNPKTFTFKNYRNDPTNLNSLSNNNVWTILNDSQNRLWLGTIGGGINRYDTLTDSFVHYMEDFENPQNTKIASNTIWFLYEDSKQRIWAGTHAGLALYVPEADTFKLYSSDAANNKSISNDWVICVYEDKKGNIWVGTHGGGLNLFNPVTEEFVYYKERDGLPNNVISGIVEDYSGNLWLSTINGISKFIPAATENDKPVFINYDASHGVQQGQFNIGSFFKSADGKIFFGGKGGFNVFHPDSIKGNEYKPPIIFTDFKIFNKSVEIGENSVLQSTINETERIELKYSQSVLTFEFAALNYYVSENNLYAYKLEGFDENWNEVGNSRTATYTNLDPGKYTLLVKGSNNDGVWSDEIKKLEIIILPPWWMTWWFRISAFLIIVGSISFIIFSRMRNLERQKRILEEKVKKRTLQLSIANKSLEEKQEEILQQNEEMKAQNELLEHRNNEIQAKNEYITSSIKYAKTMQESMLPNLENIKKYLNLFVIYIPKDIVSGDFYWFLNIDIESKNVSFIAAVDCTGHGVPGCFMSMLGATILNEIIKVKKIYDPKEILNELNKGIVQELRQETSTNQDGMEICLCKIHYNENLNCSIVYAGSGLPLYFYKTKEEEFVKIKGSRKKIGGVRNLCHTEDFFNTEISVNKNDMLYLATDGWIDQNDAQRKRLGTVEFVNVINENAKKELNLQEEAFMRRLDIHQNKQSQRDDITIMGIRI